MLVSQCSSGSSLGASGLLGFSVMTTGTPQVSNVCVCGSMYRWHSRGSNAIVRSVSGVNRSGSDGAILVVVSLVI